MPVIDGLRRLTGSGNAAIPTALLTAVTPPMASAARTAHWSARPASALPSRKVEPTAPEIALPSRSHANVKLCAVRHVPVAHVSVLPTRAVPLIVGDVRFSGGPSS